MEPSTAGITESITPSAPQGLAHNYAAWLHLSRGLYLKLWAIFALLLMPLLAISLNLVNAQFLAMALSINLGATIVLDIVGAAYIWISGVGQVWLLRLSLSTQTAGLVLAMCLAPGIPGGLTLASLAACAFQLAAAIAFLNYLIELARICGDASALQKASRCRHDLFPVFCCGITALMTGGVLAIIAIGIAYFLIPALFFIGPIFLVFALLLLYYGVDLCFNYASALARLRTAAQQAASSVRLNETR